MFALQPTPSHRPTVLVVDDQPINIDVLVEHLRGENMELLVALSGEEALLLARNNRPDLILLDVMMPDMDGYTLCSILKQDPQLMDIPVVFLTALNQETEVERGFALGAVDFIQKPFSLPILKARVRSHLALKYKGDQLARLACTDELTGIPNRRHFAATLGREWMRAQRNDNSLSVIMIDVDYFKDYNDYYGHCAGDDCLKSVAQALCGALKRPADLLARYGGEEFVVLLPETGLQSAAAVAERLRLAVVGLGLEHCRSRSGDCVTISLGLSSAHPLQLTAAEELLHRSDNLLYRAKQTGRNRVCAAAIATGRSASPRSHNGEAVC
ncbi:MAG: diguanylate cyclase [Exilibacterium sp.]